MNQYDVDTINNKMAEYKKNSYKVGEVLFYIRSNGHEYFIEYGVVSEIHKTTIYLDKYQLRDFRCINGTPIGEFHSPSKWMKFPKGIDDYRKLPLEVTNKIPAEYTERIEFSNPNEPNDILKDIECGLLVQPSKNTLYLTPYTEVSKYDGWRIVTQYNKNQYKPDYVSLTVCDVYRTYKEVEVEIQKIKDEFSRQSNLSDKEWSIEQIENTLKHCGKMCNIPDDTIDRYRQFIMALDDIEHVETRLYMEQIQWKYEKNKIWRNIVLS